MFEPNAPPPYSYTRNIDQTPHFISGWMHRNIFYFHLCHLTKPLFEEPYSAETYWGGYDNLHNEEAHFCRKRNGWQNWMAEAKIKNAYWQHLKNAISHHIWQTWCVILKNWFNEIQPVSFYYCKINVSLCHISQMQHDGPVW